MIDSAIDSFRRETYILSVWQNWLVLTIQTGEIIDSAIDSFGPATYIQYTVLFMLKCPCRMQFTNPTILRR